ncbi:MAG: YmfL family putative regulatory protein [Pigmentiphaga sp.]
MKHAILDTRKKVMSKVCSSFPGGIDCAAQFLGYERPKQLENRIYGSANSAPMPDSEIHAVEQQLGTSYLPEYICAMYGGVFVRLPEGVADNVDLHSLSIQAAARRGKVDMLIAAALADGEIDAKEAEEIMAVHRKHVAARHEEVSATIALYAKRA